MRGFRRGSGLAAPADLAAIFDSVQAELAFHAFTRYERARIRSLERKGISLPMDVRFFVTVFTTVFLAELGDKTQLATFLYAADAERSKLVVFLGAASALVATSAIGVAMGGIVAQYVSPRTLSHLAGTGFVLLGLWTIVRA